MKLFVYNTLLNHPTLVHALRYLPRIKKAKLPNALEKSYRGYPTLHRADGHSVSGEVFEVSDEGLRRLDKWEDHYRRVLVQLADGTTADAYVVDPQKFS
jgi:gamma-glutamylcyclotransferase (GGCT)/AIG2-like uncharacterized protein YtfP